MVARVNRYGLSLTNGDLATLQPGKSLSKSIVKMVTAYLNERCQNGPKNTFVFPLLAYQDLFETSGLNYTAGQIKYSSLKEITADFSGANRTVFQSFKTILVPIQVGKEHTILLKIKTLSSLQGQANTSSVLPPERTQTGGFFAPPHLVQSVLLDGSTIRRQSAQGFHQTGFSQMGHSRYGFGFEGSPKINYNEVVIYDSRISQFSYLHDAVWMFAKRFIAAELEEKGGFSREEALQIAESYVYRTGNCPQEEKIGYSLTEDSQGDLYTMKNMEILSQPSSNLVESSYGPNEIAKYKFDLFCLLLKLASYEAEAKIPFDLY